VKTPRLVPVRLLVALAVAAASLNGCAASRAVSHDRTLTVLLPDSAGLFVGNDVGVLGIAVGEISELENRGDVVAATLTITDDDVKIPADAGAAVVARSVAADRYLELTPVYDSGPTLAEGATIPVERTVTPVDFDKVLSSLEGLSDDLTSSKDVTNHLDDLLEVSASTLDGRGQDVNAATRSIAAAIGEVSSQRGTVVGTLRSLARLTGTLAGNEATVRAFVANVADAADLLASERLNIGAALSSLSASIDDVGRLARRHRAAVRRDVVALTAVLRSTLRSKGDVEGVLDALPLVGQNLLRAVEDGRLRIQLDPVAMTPLAADLNRLCEQVEETCSGLALLPALGLTRSGAR